MALDPAAGPPCVRYAMFLAVKIRPQPGDTRRLITANPDPGGQAIAALPFEDFDASAIDSDNRPVG